MLLHNAHVGVALFEEPALLHQEIVDHGPLVGYARDAPDELLAIRHQHGDVRARPGGGQSHARHLRGLVGDVAGYLVGLYREVGEVKFLVGVFVRGLQVLVGHGGRDEYHHAYHDDQRDRNKPHLGAQDLAQELGAHGVHLRLLESLHSPSVSVLAYIRAQ